MESRKKNPLSDITNAYNLIPTSSLRKLIDTSSNSNSVSKPPLSILKSNASSTYQIVGPDSSNRSDTSIGSSNVSAGRNSRNVQFRTPPRGISSITTRGGVGGKDSSNSRRRTIEKSKKEREVAIGPTPVEKRKDKGKAIAVQISQSPPEKMKYNQYQIHKPSIPLVEEKLRGNANLSVFDSPVKIAEEPGNIILKTYSCSYGKTGKGKAVLNSFGCSPDKIDDGKKRIPVSFGSSSSKTKEMGTVEKTKEKGKAIFQSSDAVEITKGEDISATVEVKSRPLRRKSQKRKNDVGASSCCPVLRTKNTLIDLDEAEGIKSSKSWTDPRPKGRKKRCSVDQSSSELPLDFIEQQRAYFKEVDEFELPVEEVSGDESD